MTSIAAELQTLIASLPVGTIITDPASMDAYRWDRAFDPDAGTPIAVARPTSTEQVQEIVRFAAAHRIAVVPRGAGSGLSGGSSAVEGGIVLSLDRMRSIEVKAKTRMAIVQPGALNAEVKAAAAAEGLWYPPDPSSFEICSIGGNVATNAGGLCCVKYGVTIDYVLGLTVVLADGKAVRLGGERVKDVAGLSLTKLFVGSEGTLGIITEVVLRLVPAITHAPTTLVAVFPSLRGSTDAVLDISNAARPSMLEFMDRTSINAVEDMLRMGLDREAEAMLVVQSDSGASAEAEVEIIEQICLRHGASEVYSTSDADEGEAFVVARRQVIPAVERMGTLLLEDVGVGVPQLSDLSLGIERIAQQREVTIALIAHAGDGNTHPLIVFDPMDEAQKQRAELAYSDVMDLALELGGTITGEHGVGRLKRPWLADYLGDDVLELNHRIKRAFDPDGILNPGAVFEA